MTKFRQKVPLFAASFSDDFAVVEAPGDESWNH